MESTSSSAAYLQDMQPCALLPRNSEMRGLSFEVNTGHMNVCIVSALCIHTRTHRQTHIQPGPELQIDCSDGSRVAALMILSIHMVTTITMIFNLLILFAIKILYIVFYLDV